MAVTLKRYCDIGSHDYLSHIPATIQSTRFQWELKTI